MRDEERTQKSSCEMESAFYHFVSWIQESTFLSNRLEAMTCVPKSINPAAISTKQDLDIESKQRWLTVDSFGWIITTNRNQVILLGFLLFCLTCLTEFSTCPVDTFLIWLFFGPNLETIEIQVLAITMQGRHWQGRNRWSEQNSSPCLFTKKEGSPLSNISYDDAIWYIWCWSHFTTSLRGRDKTQTHIKLWILQHNLKLLTNDSPWTPSTCLGCYSFWNLNVCIRVWHMEWNGIDIPMCFKKIRRVGFDLGDCLRN